MNRRQFLSLILAAPFFGFLQSGNVTTIYTKSERSALFQQKVDRAAAAIKPYYRNISRLQKNETYEWKIHSALYSKSKKDSQYE